jgi:vitamin B12/bleomycin/antimicrobial peptide transport system ATP-binding/permease protein
MVFLASTEARTVTDASKTVRPDGGPSAWEFLKFASRFWSGPTRRMAWTWSVGALLIIFANLLVNVGLNRWNRWFYDALERKDGTTLVTSVGVFVALIVVGAGFAVAMVKCRMTLQVRWREWITGELTARWLSEQRFYRLAITDEAQINPEYRLAEDVRLASEPVVEFVIGFINALLAAITFVGILFIVGGSLSVTAFGGQWFIPGYLAIAAVLYAVAMSAVTYGVGHRLVGLIGAKNEAEAQFRYEATRVRENAESIALIKGDDDERGRLMDRFGETVARWIDVIRQNSQLTWITNSNSFFAPMLPVLLAAPKYLTGELSLGAVMQIAAAFMAVLSALNWFVENFVRLAEWSASARRVNEFDGALKLLDGGNGDATARSSIDVGESPDISLHLDNLSVAHQDGGIVIADADISIGPGERVLLEGESGTGKSTLIRAIAGLWPWGHGRILLPRGANIAFVPQRPYLPLGRLRDALAYPRGGDTLTDEQAHTALWTAGLTYLILRLDTEERWDQILSGGERQRVAFARLFIERPTIIVMDEATAALDVESEHALLMRLFEALPETTIISVGHRPGLAALHTRGLTLTRHRHGGRLTANQNRTSASRSLDALRGIGKRVLKLGGEQNIKTAPPQPPYSIDQK